MPSTPTPPPPNLSQPTLYTYSDFLVHPQLANGFTALANQAFSRSKAGDTQKWYHERPRFPSLDIFYDMLTDESIVCFIFDLDRDGESDESAKTNISGRKEPKENGIAVQENGTTSGRQRLENKKIIACAAAVPWKGGWAKEGTEKETGWEIKAVCVDGDERYLRRGLAVKLLDTLERYLIDLRRVELKSQVCASGSGSGSNGVIDTKDAKGELTLWILAAECINGPYWRKRGYREVRRKTEVGPTWSCKTSFEMVVFRRDVVFDV